jgi:hypothetical protein
MYVPVASLASPSSASAAISSPSRRWLPTPVGPIATRPRMLLSAMLFDPNRWPKPNDMLGSPKQMAVLWAIVIAVAIALLIGLPALADWLNRSN